MPATPICCGSASTGAPVSRATAPAALADKRHYVKYRVAGAPCCMGRRPPPPPPARGDVAGLLERHGGDKPTDTASYTGDDGTRTATSSWSCANPPSKVNNRSDRRLVISAR